jgi:RNA polymerase sigma-70 factor (ECF subfamily)
MTNNLAEISQKSDTELVADSLADRDAFLHIINRYERALSSYIKRLTVVDEDELKDILQEIFIKVYLNLNDFNSELKFSSWIYRIAHNHVISCYRKFKARPEGYSMSIDDDGARHLTSGINIEINTDLTLAKESVGRILASLDKKYREILVLKFLEEKSYQEISDIIKKPAGTVASTINRAKAAFKLEMEKQVIKF